MSQQQHYRRDFAKSRKGEVKPHTIGGNPFHQEKLILDTSQYVQLQEILTYSVTTNTVKILS